VKAHIARKQIEAEATPISVPDVPNGGGNPSPAGGATNPVPTPAGNGGSVTPDMPQISNKHFYMSVQLDNTRINRDINNYVQEIIQHLQAVDGAKVDIKLEVDVEAKGGIPSSTVRTVSENCRTLKITDFGFDD